MLNLEIPHGFEFEDKRIDNYIARSVKSIGPEAFLQVFLNDTDLIGQIELGEKNGHGYIYLFYLFPSFRGKGYFKTMHKKAMDIFSQRGLYTLHLATPIDNRHAISVYEKYGWQKVGMHKTKPNTLLFEYHLGKT